MTVTRLWLARHGESTGNVAAAAAEAAFADRLAIDLRDADVPLTELGESQAEALGGWLRGLEQPPAVVWVSPYLRAAETARIALAQAGGDIPMRVDERLRDRELGVLDLLSARGIQAAYPDEAARRLRLGKFWYRPPGGESWADVALRLRSVLPELLAGDGPVLVVAHDVVVSLIVYVCCGMSEQQIMSLARSRAVGNATVTSLVRDGGAVGGWRLDDYAGAEHLHDDDVPVTVHPEESQADVI